MTRPSPFGPIAVVLGFVAVGAAGTTLVIGRGNPLIGPCAGQLADRGTYRQLSLKLVFDRVREDPNLERDPTPERVAAQLAVIAALRADYVPTLPDACLAAHVADWLDYYEREARTAIARKAERNGFPDEYQKRQAEEEDRVRALAARLGVKR